MCLSTVFYTDENNQEQSLEQIIKISTDKNGSEQELTMSTLFGESKTISGYYIKDIDLNKNSIQIKKI